MRRLLVTLALLVFLQSCTTVRTYPTYEGWGFLYPVSSSQAEVAVLKAIDESYGTKITKMDRRPDVKIYHVKWLGVFNTMVIIRTKEAESTALSVSAEPPQSDRVAENMFRAIERNLGSSAVRKKL